MCRIAICDDDIFFAEQLQEYINKYCREMGWEVSLKVYTDSDELAEAVEKRKLHDLYILDIMMPEHTGMDLLSLLEGNETTAEVILLTSYSGYAVEACSYKKVFRYILKEEIFPRLWRALDVFFEETKKKQKQRPYIIKNKIKCVKFYQEDVAYICRDRKYAVFVMEGERREKERCSLSEVYQKLQNPDMVILDRSYIVNIPHIRKICLDEVQMDNGDVLRTNRNHVQRLKVVFTQYWGELL